MLYSTIVDTVKECFPEIQQHDECNLIIEYADELAHLPHLFFPAFWKLLELCLTDIIQDDSLRDRIFDFMEEMATNEDGGVVNLMVIEMIEPLFGLDYEIYNRVVRRYLHPKTLELYYGQIPYFHAPKPKGSMKG